METNLDKNALVSLRKRLWIPLIIWVAACGVYSLFLSRLTSVRTTYMLTAIPMVLAVPVFAVIYLNLHQNRLASYAVVHPRMEIPVNMQIVRAWFLAGLAAYCFIPFVYTNLEWVPGIFLALSLVTGVIGRFSAVITGRNFLLADVLFEYLDGFGLVTGCAALVLSTRASPVLLTVGGITIFFAAGDWMVRKIQKKIPGPGGNPTLRLTAALMTGYLAGALIPLYSSEINTMAGVILLIVMAVIYLRIYFSIKRVDRIVKQMTKGGNTLLVNLGLLILRLAAGFLVMLSPLFPTDITNFSLFMMCFAGILGVFPRLCFLGIIGYTGFALSTSGNERHYLLAFCLAEILVIFGGGSFAIWSPEKKWLRAYAGEM